MRRSEDRAGSGRGNRQLYELVDVISGSSGVVGRTLAAARKHLGMEVAFVAKFSGDRLAFQYLEGDSDSFSFERGGGIPLDSSYCHRLAEGRLPNVIPDARGDERVRDLEVTTASGIGAYVGVPLQFSGGDVYGTLCCLNHDPDPSLRQRDADFVKVLARLVSEQLEREELQERNRRLEIKATGANALAAALEARDGYTGEHARSVVDLSAQVARGLDLSREETEYVEQTALLHDVGKLGVSDAVLRKPGTLDPDEWKEIKEHPEAGERIVSSIESLAHLAPAIRAEHERWDGAGYPDGLAGEGIPLASRIVLACDAFHAMTSDRPYRKAMSLGEAVEELEGEAGEQFDPRIVRKLVEVLGARNTPPGGNGPG